MTVQLYEKPVPETDFVRHCAQRRKYPILLKVIYERNVETYNSYCCLDICTVVNPHQNDQGRKGPCCFQRLIALKCRVKKLKKYLFLIFEVYFLVNPTSCS